ncbi:unnamed protein product, partial [Musa banksii]
MRLCSEQIGRRAGTESVRRWESDASRNMTVFCFVVG